MPLVVFKIAHNEGYPNIVGQVNTQALNGYKMTVNLPREAYNRRWWLRSINASVFYDNAATQRLRWIEVELPQLMPEEHVLYHLEVAEEDKGAIPEPKKRLRFYPNIGSMDQTQFHPSLNCVSLSPNLNMGTHRLDRLQLDMIIYASNVDENDTGLNTFELILEYE